MTSSKKDGMKEADSEMNVFYYEYKKYHMFY